MTSNNPMTFPHSSMTSATTNPSIHDTTTCNNLYQQHQNQYNTPGFSGYTKSESSIPPSTYIYHTPRHTFPTPFPSNYRYNDPQQDYQIGWSTPFNMPSMSTYHSSQSYPLHSIPQPVSTESPFPFYPHYSMDPSTLVHRPGLPELRNSQQNARPVLEPMPKQLHNWDSPSPFYMSEWFEYDPFNRKCERCQCPSCLGLVVPKYVDGKRLHLCHIKNCNKMYNKTSQLKTHLRWHMGERPYICKWSSCDKTFTRSDELLRHIRTHTGYKKYQCNKCSKKFMRSDHLNKHVKIHENPRNKQNVTAG